LNDRFECVGNIKNTNNTFSPSYFVYIYVKMNTRPTKPTPTKTQKFDIYAHDLL
jgi:hypothetical protein